MPNVDIAKSYEEKMNRLHRHLEKISPDIFVVYTFDKMVIAKDWSNGKYYEIPYSEKADGTIESKEAKEVEATYIQKMLVEEDMKITVNKSDKELSMPMATYLYYKREGMYPAEEDHEKGNSQELTGPIFKTTEKQRIVYAAVLVPGEPDHDYDKGEKILTAEEVEYVAHKWMEEYGNIDYMHGLNNVAKPIETFILPMDWEVTAYKQKMTLPKGTWVMAAKVTNDQAWKDVESGKLTGFSIMGIQNSVMKSIMEKVSKGEAVNKQIEASVKRVLIRDLGPKWIVPFVSLVDEACVPKSKFFAIKSRTPELPAADPADEDIINKGEKTVWDNIMSMFKKDEFQEAVKAIAKMKTAVLKAGRSISNDTYTKLKGAIEALSKLLEKADKERKPDYLKNKKKKGDELEMDEKDVSKLIEKKLEEKLVPIHETLKKLLPEEKPAEEDKAEAEVAAKEKAAKEKEEADKAKKEEEDKDKEKDALKSEVSTLKDTLDKLQKARKAVSKGIAGQEDNDPPKEAYTTKDHLKGLERDSFGCAIKKA